MFCPSQYVKAEYRITKRNWFLKDIKVTVRAETKAMSSSPSMHVEQGDNIQTLVQCLKNEPLEATKQWNYKHRKPPIRSFPNPHTTVSCYKQHWGIPGNICSKKCMLRFRQLCPPYTKSLHCKILHVMIHKVYRTTSYPVSYRWVPLKNATVFLLFNSPLWRPRS